ncbi:MAG: hypothetical protein ACR2IE_14835 [Candidatus Sumerlaeaceae bacterium]
MRVLLLVAVISYAVPAVAQWSNDPLVNTAISTATGTQLTPMLTGDGAGGAIIVWEDNRGGGNPGIYAQRVSSTGQVQWAANGVGISAPSPIQEEPAIVSDGSGGALIFWCDDHGTGSGRDIYAQRVNGSGVLQWAGAGVAVGVATNTQQTPVAVPDGSGGAVVVWKDFRSGGTAHLYAQRVSGAGALLWAGGTSGVAVHTASDVLLWMGSTDGAGGMLLAWEDVRNGNFDAYAQRIKVDGTLGWAAGGVPAVSVAGDQRDPVVVTDGAGGAFVAWQDYAGSFAYYAQRLSGASGAQLWASTNGLRISRVNSSCESLAADGTGRFYAALQDNSVDGDVYANLVDSSGNLQWNSYTGSTISNAASYQYWPTVVADGTGAIFLWMDYRNGLQNVDIYGQRVNASGTPLLTANGVALSTAASKQEFPEMVLTAPGTVILTWADQRVSSTDVQVYATQFVAGVSGVQDWALF